MIFVATGLTQGASNADDTEVLAHRRVHFTELLAGVLEGNVREAMSVAAALCAQHYAASRRLPAKLCESMLTVRKIRGSV